MDELYHIKHIDLRYFDTPSVALSQARAEIVRMGEAVQVMFDDVMESLRLRNTRELSKWRKREDALDTLQREITQFLVRVMQDPILPEESREVASLMRMVNNLERTGDAIENVAYLVEDLIEEKLYFSEEAISDYKEISGEVRKLLFLVVDGIRGDDRKIMPAAQAMENNIDRMREGMKEAHILRLKAGVCSVDPGLILVDMLAAFEKMGDFCYNIAQAVAGVK